MDTVGIVEVTTQGEEPPSPSSLSIKTISLHFAEANEAGSQHSALPPVDGGFAAWSYLVAAFLTDVLIWGFPSSSGILLAAYLGNPVYSSQHSASSLLPLIGTLCTGIMYCSGIVIYPLIDYYPYMRRYFTWAGTLVCTCSLLGASFTTEITTLVALQGVLFAVGGSFAYAPVISYLPEWFVRRRGLANGIFFCGAGLAGILLPVIFPPLIKRFGVMVTVRGYALTLFIGMIPALLFVKPRLPESRVRGPNPRARNNRTWLLERNLWFFVTINLVQGFGYFVPIIWLPTYGLSLGLDSTKGSLSLTLFNVFGNLSCFVVGWMSDKYDVWLLTLSSLVLACLSTFILWGICSFSLAGILVYSSAYGAVAGGFSSLWSAFVRPIAKEDSSLSTTLVGYMFLTRGIGNIVSTPISTALQHAHSTIQSRSLHKTGFSVAGGRYQDMIIYTGSCFAGAALITVIGWSLDKRYRKD